jgi:hypothetical protein
METTRFLFRIRRKEINFVQTIIESYDGIATVSTVDPQEAVIELMISPSCEAMILELIDSLKELDGIDFIRK